MKRVHILIILLLSIIIVGEAKVAVKDSFIIKRGLNLSHWLSQDFGWEPKYTYIQEQDIEQIAKLGFDHVRIPVDEVELWDEEGKPIAKAFDLLKSCLDWCQKHNLRAIVDLHIIRSHYFNASHEGSVNTLWTDPREQEHFINLWNQLSAVLCSYPTSMVAYELLNEAVAPTPEDWNKLFNKALTELRKTEPDRVIVIGSNMWQIVQLVPLLDLPENDKNIIISFHFYSPLLFTHYTASWTPLKNYRTEITYPGMIVQPEVLNNWLATADTTTIQLLEELKEPFNKNRIKQMIRPAIEFAKSKKLPLYCGEFGCLPTVPRTARLAYYSDLISVFEEEDIAWTKWEYKGEFGIYFFDFETKKNSGIMDTDLINELLQYRNK